MSETSVQVRSQLSIPGANTSLDSNGSRIIPIGSTQAQKHALNKPRFVEFACSYVEVEIFFSQLRRWCFNSYKVYRYVVLVTNAVIPKAFWGSNRNLKAVLQCWRSFLKLFTSTDISIDVMEFIQCRRYETLSLHHVVQKFSTADCDWLIPPGPGARQQTRVCVSDALKRRELLEDFSFWYFDSFVLPLLRARLHSARI